MQADSMATAQHMFEIFFAAHAQRDQGLGAGVNHRRHGLTKQLQVCVLAIAQEHLLAFGIPAKLM